MELKDVLKRPVITEKSMMETALGKYAFEVDRRATKIMVAKAVERYFQVKPVSVKTMNVKGKTRWAQKVRKRTKMSGWKKALVTLKKGDKIEAFQIEG